MYIHVVSPGDSIFSIARQYGVSEQRIATDNGLAGLPYLVPGQALIVLVPQVIHTVRPGETPASIAGQYGITVLELLQRNPTLIQNPQLSPGRQLSITFQGQTSFPAALGGYAYPNISQNVLRRALPYLTDCTVFGYGFTENGDLIPPADETAIIAAAYRYRTAPVLLISSITEDGNFSGERASILFNDRQLQDHLIDQLLGVMYHRGYLGLDVDFEYVEPDDTGAFLEFLEHITVRMHRSGFRVNVDLAPKTSSEQRGLLYEAHDYAAIGAIADTVLLMTYEWGYTYGPPMAVAPLPNVRQVAAYAATQIPPEKILLGIPNYGYDWQLPYQRGTTRAVSIGNEQAVRIAAQHGASIQFDETAQAPFFEYYAPNARKHIVWFEDVRSIRGKFGLIEEFGLRGAAYWNLMRPFAQNWALVSQQFAVRRLLP